MARAVLFRPEAAAELSDARLWYAARQDGLGERFLQEVEAIVARIVEWPAAFPSVHGQTRRAVLRRFPYAVYFREVSDAIVVLAVHGRQNPQRWQSRS